MVQRMIPKGYHCGPTGRKESSKDESNRTGRKESSKDESNRTERLSVAETSPNTISMCDWQTLALVLMYLLQASEMWWRLGSGKAGKVPKTHLEPREIQTEDRPTRPLSRPFVDAVEGEDTASESRLSPDGHDYVDLKRKRRGSSFATAHTWIKRRAAEIRRAAARSDYDSDSEDEPDEPDDLEDAGTETRQLRVDELRTYFYIPSFLSICQLACKDILKAWIRICHPGKQTSHPYNGGNDRERSFREYLYPGHFTKPDYWAPDVGWHLLQSPTFNACRHREPDHVKKPERLVLLVHLLRCQYKGFKDGTFDIEKMEESTKCFQPGTRKGWKRESVDCLKEIYRVRRKEMEFERGEIDADTLVTVRMPKPRKSRKPPSPVKAVTRTERPPTERSSPIANLTMRVDEPETPSAGSEPSIRTDTPSSAEHVALDASGSESPWPESLPLYNSPTPYLGQGRTFVSTPGRAQRELPLRSAHPSESSSIPHFPSQAAHCQFGYESTAPRLGANQTRQSGPFTRSPPAQPVALKVENICHPTFAASSSCPAEAFLPTEVDYSTDYWSPQIEPTMYTAGTDPMVPYLPCTNGPFGNGHAWTDGNWVMMPADYEGLDEDLRQRLITQAASVPRY